MTMSLIIQWNAEILTRLNFGQITSVREQFMLESNYVQNPKNFVRSSDENLCSKAERLCLNNWISDILPSLTLECRNPNKIFVRNVQNLN